MISKKKIYHLLQINKKQINNNRNLQIKYLKLYIKKSKQHLEFQCNYHQLLQKILNNLKQKQIKIIAKK